MKTIKINLILMMASLANAGAAPDTAQIRPAPEMNKWAAENLTVIRAADARPPFLITRHPRMKFLDHVYDSLKLDTLFSFGSALFWLEDTALPISRHDGTDDTLLPQRGQIASVLEDFEKFRGSDSAVSHYRFRDHSAEKWWRANRRFNYVPLVIDFLTYRPISPELELKAQRTYFAAYPFKESETSRLVTFGIEDAFMHTNTGKSIHLAELTLPDGTVKVPASGLITVGFQAAGVYRIPVRVFFTDGTMAACSFEFEVKHFREKYWKNSKLNEYGELEFTSTQRR